MPDEIRVHIDPVLQMPLVLCGGRLCSCESHQGESGSSVVYVRGREHTNLWCQWYTVTPDVSFLGRMDDGNVYLIAQDDPEWTVAFPEGWP